MKNIPLVLKIWLVFASLTLSLFMLLAFSLPWTLKGFFTEQIYDILLDSQKAVPKDVIRVNLSPNKTAYVSPALPSLSPLPSATFSAESAPVIGTSVITELAPDSGATSTIESAPADGSILSPVPLVPHTQGVPTKPVDVNVIREKIELSFAPGSDGATFTKEIKEARVPASTVLRIAPNANGPGIQHLVITQESIPTKLAAILPQPFVQAIEQDAGNQQAITQSYSLSIAERTMFYVISKEQIEGNTGYMISYAWGNYRNDLVMTMFWRLMLLIVVLILLSWLPCLWLARYLSRPLVLMEQQAARMAERDWHEPFVLNRKDEMGRLAQAFESMRQRLVRQDKAQQFFLQNISHELKTPVMVIHSYAQSILDGIYPKGSVAASVETIMGEAVRLEKRVKDLLYLNKLNYLSTRERQRGQFDLSKVIGECIERLRYRRQDLNWQTSLSPFMLEGDAEQWSVAIENILDNQLRYAENEITVTFELLTAAEEKDPGKIGAAHVDETANLDDVDVNNSAAAAADVRSESVSFPRWIVRIWNDGPPVNEEVLATIFEQFQTGPDGQFGLGLAISRQILAYHHASIRASNEYSGVAFYLEPG
jgi:two-component system sensor histidine kinase CssS